MPKDSGRERRTLQNLIKLFEELRMCSHFSLESFEVFLLEKITSVSWDTSGKKLVCLFISFQTFEFEITVDYGGMSFANVRFFLKWRSSQISLGVLSGISFVKVLLDMKAEFSLILLMISWKFVKILWELKKFLYQLIERRHNHSYKSSSNMLHYAQFSRCMNL